MEAQRSPLPMSGLCDVDHLSKEIGRDWRRYQAILPPRKIPVGQMTMPRSECIMSGMGGAL